MPDKCLRRSFQNHKVFWKIAYLSRTWKAPSLRCIMFGVDNIGHCKFITPQLP